MEEESETERRRWEEACRREAVVRELLRRHPKRLTIKSVEDAAWELGLSRATMYTVSSTGIARAAQFRDSYPANADDRRAFGR